MGRTLLKTERVHDRDDIAAHLEEIVRKLRSGETITLQSGEDEVSLDPADQVELEIHVEEESSGDMSLEIELEWNGQGGDPIDIT